MFVYYRGKDIGTRRVLFLVGNCVLVELKAMIQLEDAYYA